MDILKLASIVGSIVTILSAIGLLIKIFISVYKIARKLEKYIEDTQEYRKKADERIDENTIYTLKLVIMNNDLSLEERIAAGDKYVALGGNGYVKHIYQNLLEKIDSK